MDTKEVISPGYGLPEKKNFSRNGTVFVVIGAPNGQKSFILFFSYCLQCHKKIGKGGYHLKRLATTFLLCLLSNPVSCIHSSNIQHTPSRLSFGLI